MNTTVRELLDNDFKIYLYNATGDLYSLYNKTCEHCGSLMFLYVKDRKFVCSYPKCRGGKQ